jgi:hypothetical protein
MKASFSKLLAAPLAIFALSSLALAPMADAAGRGGGGGAARGGGAHAGGGGGARQNTQINNNRADVRTNNVRSTSVNNVNVNKNVNVDVDRGCCGGWDNDYHPVATAAAVTATVAVTSNVIGSMVRTVPAGCVPVNYGGTVYQQCGTTWYQPQGPQFVVVNPPY